LEIRSPDDYAMHSEFPGGLFLGLPLTLQALACQLSSGHLSFSEKWLCVGFTSLVMYLAWHAPAPGPAGRACPQHSASRHPRWVRCQALLCSASSNTTPWTWPESVGDSTHSIKMSWPLLGILHPARAGGLERAGNV